MSYEDTPLGALTVLPRPTVETEQAAIEARQKLFDEFPLADAPLTGRKLVCALETDEGRLIMGHNTETPHANGPTFHHAEVNAMQSLAAQSIKTIYIGGFDTRQTGQKLRHIAPCSDCYTQLSTRLTPQTSLVVYEPTSFSKAYVFNREDIADSYDPKEPSEITATDFDEICQQLAKKTEMTESDCEIMADLRLQAIGKGVGFYLLGSASGRSGVSTHLHKLMGTKYDDIDIAAVAPPADTPVVRTLVRDVLARHIGDTDIRTVRAQTWNTAGPSRGSRRETSYDTLWHQGRKLVDLAIGPTMETAISRPDFRIKNFFHKLV